VPMTSAMIQQQVGVDVGHRPTQTGEIDFMRGGRYADPAACAS
jgi:hypothetical protein